MRLHQLLLTVLLLLAGCSGTRLSHDDVESTGDLIQYLDERGHVLRATRLTVPFALATSGHEYRSDRSIVRIYEFDTAEEACEEGVTDFLLDTRGGDTSVVFQSGTLVVAYAGEDASLQLTLAQMLGPALY